MIDILSAKIFVSQTFYVYQQQQRLMSLSPASTVYRLTTNPELLIDYRAATGTHRQEISVDRTPVLRDVNEITKTMNIAFSSHQVGFDIVPRRTDPHISQINVQLNKVIQRNVSSTDMTRKIAAI